MGRYMHEGVTQRKPIGDFTPVPLEELRKRRLQRAVIEAFLDGQRPEIEARAAIARRKKTNFSLHLDGDLCGGVLTEGRVSSIIRAWVWETYQGAIGFSRHVYSNGEAQIDFCVE